MFRRPDLDLLQRALRVYVCKACPRQTPGTAGVGCAVTRPCEHSCALFVHLPLLKKAAEQVDPMLRGPERVLLDTVDALVARDASTPMDVNPLAQYRKQVAGLITKLIDY